MEIQESKTSNNSFAYLDIKIGLEKSGRVIIELFDDIVPRTVKNFKSLCLGSEDPVLCKPLCYQGTQFHRVVPQFMVQGGDVTKNDGTGGRSIYGKQFDDENFELTHSEEGRVGMANAGANTNNSQFYITTVPCPHLDNINVVFGQVRKGLNIIREMGEVPRDNDVPIIKCIIEKCGILEPGKLWGINENDGTLDVYPPWPDDWEVASDEKLENVISNIKHSGNYYFKRHNYVDSDRKYKKALRYIDYLLTSGSGYDSKIVSEIKVCSLLNLAAVRIKKGKFQDANIYCNQAIALDSQNGKAHYRRAQALIGLKEYDKALLDLNKAYNFCPSDKLIQNELQKVKNLKLNYLQKEKMIFSKMFSTIN
ncbi:hypothetical protein PPYR_06690 [Photinus pyralis]|uniref:peptidylprolyl isomerase n=2 Tax=Photinus pyralis TaxID=7054 RepID=A0A1Y1LML8_PHOPY|nr:peptidyl-prolyl cis-trans isomerase D-like isoform X1 [Photinus pyralis]KAB0798810.1 hypothetical protein PPYR_06690 [Photinus pyralis]